MPDSKTETDEHKKILWILKIINCMDNCVESEKYIKYVLHATFLKLYRGGHFY